MAQLADAFVSLAGSLDDALDFGTFANWAITQRLHLNLTVKQKGASQADPSGEVRLPSAATLYVEPLRTPTMSRPQNKNTPYKMPQGIHKEAWKIFGIELPAGRRVKTLYNRTDMTPISPSKTPFTHRLPDKELYVAENTLNTASHGLQYHRSLSMLDMCPGRRDYLKWGSVVCGVRVDAGWVKVGTRYLPTTVASKRVLRCLDTAEVDAKPQITAPYSPLVLNRACSLPALQGSRLGF